MTLNRNDPVVLDGLLTALVVTPGSCGQHLVRVTASALVDGFVPYLALAQWDGDARSVDGLPLMTSLEPSE